MYGILRRWLPAPAVNALYAVWYALLIVLIYYYAERPPAAFYYLHR